MFEAIADILPHAVETLRGDVKDDGRPDLDVSGEHAPRTDGRVIHHRD
jgi:hypothetical protein